MHTTRIPDIVKSVLTSWQIQIHCQKNQIKEILATDVDFVQIT